MLLLRYRLLKDAVPRALWSSSHETLAIIAYKQPVTGPEIGEIRGVDTGGVLGTLLERKLITTAGRKQVIGRRLKQTGARWKVRRVERMATLCALQASDQWDTYWRHTA